MMKYPDDSQHDEYADQKGGKERVTFERSRQLDSPRLHRGTVSCAEYVCTRDISKGVLLSCRIPLCMQAVEGKLLAHGRTRHPEPLGGLCLVALRQLNCLGV